MKHHKIKKLVESSTSTSTTSSVMTPTKVSKKKLEKYLAKPLKCSHIKLEINAKQIEDDLMMLNLMSNNGSNGCNSGGDSGIFTNDLLVSKESVCLIFT
jgi:hypothetical protein